MSRENVSTPDWIDKTAQATADAVNYTADQVDKYFGIASDVLGKADKVSKFLEILNLRQDNGKLDSIRDAINKGKTGVDATRATSEALREFFPKTTGDKGKGPQGPKVDPGLTEAEMAATNRQQTAKVDPKQVAKTKYDVFASQGKRRIK
jgi:hypothetical protein